VVGITVVLAVDLSSKWIPAVLKGRDLIQGGLTRALGGSRFGPGLRRQGESDGSRVVATDSALEAEQKAELPKLTAAQRERTEAAGELAKQEAALAQRQRILERSLADAERSAAEATARIEARDAALATQEAELRQKESELADRHRSVAERELIMTRADLRPRKVTPSKSPEDGLGAVESDWWEKQLGRPLSAAELKAQGD